MTSVGRKRFGTLRGSGIGAMQNACFPTDMSDAQWKTLLPHLPKPAKRGRPRTDLRRILDAVLYLVKSGTIGGSEPLVGLTALINVIAPIPEAGTLMGSVVLAGLASWGAVRRKKTLGQGS